jgi:hypothetical protein
MVLARFRIEAAYICVEQAERHPSPTYMRRPIAIRLVETPGPHDARSIAPPGWEKVVLACPCPRNHQPTVLLKPDNPAHDRRTIRLTIAAHPGSQIPRGEWHGILRCNSKPSNRGVYADGEGIMGKCENESIWNEYIAVGAL